MPTMVTRKMIPTERGKLLYSEVAPLVEALEQLSAEIKTSSLPSLKWIKIGSAPEFYQEKILPLLPKFGTCSISHFGTADKLLDIQVRLFQLQEGNHSIFRD